MPGKSLANQLANKTASAAFDILLPLAERAIAEPSFVTEGPFSRHRLNPFQIDLGDVADVQGRAVYALARLNNSLSGVRIGELIPRIEGAMTSLNPVVRMCALASVGEVQAPSESLLFGVLLATRDGDPRVARAGFQALIGIPGLELSAPQWRAFTHGIKMALQSTDVALRFEAARAAAKLCRNREVDEETPVLKEIEDLITHDVSSLVRAQWA